MQIILKIAFIAQEALMSNVSIAKGALNSWKVALAGEPVNSSRAWSFHFKLFSILYELGIICRKILFSKITNYPKIDLIHN